MKKRGSRSSQAALEFMVRRGWIIMVLLLMLGGAFYYDLFDVDKFLTNKCSLENGLICTGHRINENSVVLSLKNARKVGITLNEIKVQHCSGTNSRYLKQGEETVLAIYGCSNIPDTKYFGNVTISFTEKIGMNRTSTGILIGEVQEGNSEIIPKSYKAGS